MAYIDISALAQRVETLLTDSTATTVNNTGDTTLETSVADYSASLAAGESDTAAPRFWD